MDEPTVTTLATAWRKRHNFDLPARRLLVDTLFARRYREIQSKPRRFTILLPESIRTQHNVDRGTAQAIMIKNRTLDVESVIADEVHGHHELWTRIRADFSTMALCSILDTAYYSYGDCEEFCDRILAFINARYSDRLAPVEFYVNAFIKTMQEFTEQVRIHDKTLASVINDHSRWHHFWVYQHVSGQRGVPLLPIANGGPDTDKEMQQEVDRLRALAKNLQSQKDRQVAELAKSRKHRESANDDKRKGHDDKKDKAWQKDKRKANLKPHENYDNKRTRGQGYWQRQR